MNEKRYMDTRELSEYLGVSKWMIYKYIENRDIPFIPFGRLIRFDRVAVERWAEKKMIPAASSRNAMRNRPEEAKAEEPSRLSPCNDPSLN